MRDPEYAICPYCGCEHGDCWEWADETPRNYECADCGRAFRVHAEYCVQYVTEGLEGAE